MSSFFDLLGLEKQVVSDESANMTGGFRTINGGTNSIGLVHSAKWREANAEYGTKAYIIVKWKLIDTDTAKTSFAGCFADLKLHIYDDDLKKRQKSSNLFSRLYLLAGLQPPATIPTDQDLAAFANKMLGIEVSYWCNQSEKDGVWRDGNYVNALHSTANFVGVDGTEVPKDLNALNMPKTQTAPGMQPPTPGMQQAPVNTQPQVANQAPVNTQPTPVVAGGWG